MCDSADYQNKPKDRKTTGYLTTSSSNTDRKDTQKKAKKKVKGNIC